MLAVVVAAAATVLTASHRELLADCVLPHSQSAWPAHVECICNMQQSCFCYSLIIEAATYITQKVTAAIC